MNSQGLLFGAGIALVAVAVAWVVTMPQTLSSDTLAALPEGNAARGEQVFWEGGCASCHGTLDPDSKTVAADGKLRLAGGLALKTPFGTFVAPNISPDREDGIGAWNLDDFANAMLTGTSPEGRHYYPAFPYTSYARMNAGDVSDLFAFLKTLEPVQGKTPGHQLGFPFNLRRGLGLWKNLNLSSEPVIALADLHPTEGDRDEDLLKRGRYLVEGPGHCGECHTPRDAIGSIDATRWLDGAEAAAGEGKVPGISPGHAIDDWSASDIAYYLESGFTPDYDSVGGEMVEVQENMARLPARDREAIAAYLKALPRP